MQLKKFYFRIGGYGGNTYTLELKAGKFVYTSFPDDTDAVYIDMGAPRIRFSKTGKITHVEETLSYLESSNATLTLDPEKLDHFLRYAKQHCRHWKKSYDTLTLDGIQWEVDIWTDQFRLKSDGSNDYPGNFESFTWRLTLLTGGKMF